MAAKNEGLTLEGLAQMLETQAQQLETLQHENAELRSEVTARRVSSTYRDEVAEMGGSGTGQGVKPAPEADGVVSRRALLGKAGAAVAAMAAGTLLYPREARANHHGPGIEVDYVRAHSDNGDGVYAVSGNTDLSTGRRGVFGYAYNPDWAGVEGGNTNGIGVRGYGETGVRGEGDTGVWGSSSRGGWSGVYGQHTGTSGYGIVGDGKGGSAGVLGRNSGGEGVRGEGSTGAEVAGVRGLGKTGVWGSSSATGYSGVYGQHTGTSGYGVVGDGRGSGGAGVLGRNRNGYGGQFEGGKAQLRLAPTSSAGRPTTGAHANGELYLDSAGTLFVCTDSGTPGTWRRFQTAAT